MLNMSTTIHQAEIDAACELIDFWRFNPHFMEEVYGDQPISTSGGLNYMEHRPLDGFVLALTPFNFTSIAENLPPAPALMGNTVVWKPASMCGPASVLSYEDSGGGGPASRGDQLCARSRAGRRPSGSERSAAGRHSLYR